MKKKEIEDAKSKLTKLHFEIKSIMPDLSEFIEIDRVSISEIKEGTLDGESIKRVIIILRSTGCDWSREEHGGCTMCGHITGTVRSKEITSDVYCKQFDEELSKYNFEDYPMLCLYNSGSFLNPKEIPLEARNYILDRINKTKGIKRLIIESRPEYINNKTLLEINNICNNIKVEIGVGLETLNQEIRDLCLNKGIKNSEYIEISENIKKYSNILLLGYVLIKPPFLTENESIIDAIETVKFAFDIGFDVISLEPVSVQDFTLTHFLHESGYFRPPWIWSVIQVVRAVHKKGLVRIGGFEFFPIPKIFTNNCSNCNEKMIKAIKHFNSNYDVSIFDNLMCNCIEEWEYDKTEELPPIPKRIRNILDSVNKEDVLKKMKMSFDVRGISPSLIERILFNSCYKHNLY